MELRHLRYFVAVAEELHVGNAAARLHIVAPALSRQIAALERDLGFPLFHRHKGRLTLTRAGSAFHDEARAILRRVDRATAEGRSIATGETGTLAVGFVGPAMWAWLPAILREHRRRYPDVHFQLPELTTAAQVSRLHEGRLDIGFVRPFVHDQLIATEVLWDEPVIVVLPDDHGLARAPEIDLAELSDETFMMTPQDGSPAYYEQYVQLCRAYGFAPARIEEIDTTASSLHMVAGGLGVALAPASVASSSWPNVVFRPLAGATVRIETAIAWRRDEPAPLVETFLTTARRVVAGEARSRAIQSIGSSGIPV